MCKWIPVSERLPKEGERCLIYPVDGDVETAIFEHGEWMAWDFFIDIIVQILINGEDRTRKYDKFGSEIQYNITWDSDKPNKKYLTIFNFCEFALYSYDIWNSKDGDILERIQYHEKFNVITRDRFIFNKNRYWLQNK